MKKLSRIFAMTMALALTFGMTALAAPSVSTENPAVNNDVLADQAEATTANVGSTAVVVEAADVVTYDAAVVATKSTALVGDVNVKAVAAVVELTATIPAGETVNVTINNSAIDASKKYIVLHQKADGTWESVPVVAVSAGAITATFSSLSPVAIVEVEAKAGSTSSAPAATPSTPAASPKTGETASVAVIAMLLCLSGAAVAATKRAKAN